MPTDVATAIREVTDDEVAHYHEYGWVKLEGLISPDLAAEMLRVAEQIREDSKDLEEISMTLPQYPDFELKRRRGPKWVASWSNAWFEARKIRLDPFYSLTFSRELGRNASRLMNRKRLTDDEVPVRYLEDALLCKYPAGQESSKPTGYHQDNYGMDRVGGFTFWIALDEVTPEMGALRYLTGSHREGPLGVGKQSILERYPKLLERYEWSPPFHYKPGDATAHFEKMVHGAEGNETGRPRWSYVPTYIPGDGVMASDHSQTDPDMFGHGMPPPLERFPIVWPQ